MEKFVEKMKIIEYEKKIVFLEKKVSDLEMIKVGRNDIKCYICNGLPCGQKGPRYTRSRRKVGPNFGQNSNILTKSL